MYLASGNSVRQQHPLELAFKINTFKSMPTYRQVTRVCFIDNIGPESCIQRGEEGGLQGQSTTIYWYEKEE